MAGELMHKAMVEELERLGVSESQKSVWHALWNEAQSKPGEPLPCPACFVNDARKSRLKPLDRLINAGQETGDCTVNRVV